MGKQTKQKTNSNEESLLNRIKKLEVDNFQLSSPQGLVTVGPLPSTSGGNATPSNTTTTTSPTTTATTPVTTPVTTPTQPIFTSSASRQSVNHSETRPMNAEERARIEAENNAEIARVDAINSQLPAEMKRLNDSFVGHPKSMYDSTGAAKMYELSPAMPLPIMPRLKEVPNLVTGTFSDGYSNYDKNTTGGGSHIPRPVLRNTKFDLDANTGTLGVSTVDTDNFKQDAGIDQLSKKTNLEAMKTVDNYIAQTYPTIEDSKGSWVVESGGNENNRKAGEAGMTGSMTDALTRHIGNYLVKNYPDLLVTNLLTRKKDGSNNYDFSNGNLPLMAHKAYNIVDSNGKAIEYTEDNWKRLKDKPGYRIQSNQRYNRIIEKAVSEFMEKNGLSSKGYDTSKPFYTSYDDGTKAALEDPRNRSQRQRHATNQMIPTRDALKWKIMYGHTLGGA